MIINRLTSSVESICAQLKDQGYRLTPQRRAIVKVLLECAQSHPSAKQVFIRVRRVMPDLSYATVYHTLHELVNMNAILQLDLGLREQRYDLNIADHSHLVCLGCMRIEDVPFDSERLTLPPEHDHGFRVTNCSVLFRGYCANCASQEKG